MEKTRSSLTVDMNLPSNSHKRQVEKNEEPVKRVQKVISGSVRTKKKSLTTRFLDTFIKTDATSVLSYVMDDVLIPAAKATLSDMLHTSIDMFTNGDGGVKSSRRNRDRGRATYVSYDKQYRNDDRRRESREVSPQNRARHNFDDIVFESRGEAEEVRSHLVDLIADYDMASVADLYDLVGIPSNFTDGKWGWTNLSRSSVSRIRDGYVLNLPKPTCID